MKKLSKHQVEVLVIMCEGEILDDTSCHVLWLTDADHNNYKIRYDTFKILQRLGYIEVFERQSIDVYSYTLTEEAKRYLRQNHFEKVKAFIESQNS